MPRSISFQLVEKILDERLSIYECRDLSDAETADIKMSPGCLMSIDREKFVEIGGFDERFFIYFKDNDLRLRFGKAGYQILYMPFGTVVHTYEEGAHKSRKPLKIFMQSMGKFFNKRGWRFL